jgi:EmrB/QacA subfamily drug resistance transporter
MASLTIDAAITAFPRREVRTIIFGVMLAMLLAGLDQTIVAPALPTIGRELGAFNAIGWVATAYLLTSTAVTPIYGKLSDLYGRRRLLLVGIAVFALGSLLCALAPDMLSLILARALQGVGGGGLIALANTVVGDVISPRDRGRYQGYFASTYALSSVAGPLLGGFFAERFSWTLIFWINLPLCAIAAAIVDRTLRRLPVRGTRHHIDYPGSLLMVTATISLLLALTWGGHRYGWASAPILGLLAAALLLGTAFVWRQSVVTEPVLPLPLLGNPVIRLAALAGLLIMLVNVSVIVYLPLYLELCRGLSAGQAGVVLIPEMIGVVLGAIVSGQYMRLVGRYKLVPIAGAAIASLALALLGAAADRIGIIGVAGGLLAIGVGLGTTMPALLVATQNATTPGDLGTATAVHTFFRTLGGAVGIAALGAVLLGSLADHGGALAPGSDLAMLLAAAREPALVAAAGDAFSLFFKVCAVLTAGAVAGLLLLKEIPLRHKPAGAPAE